MVTDLMPLLWQTTTEEQMARELTPEGGPCCATEFFEPLMPFYKAMEPYKGRRIIDIGAGQGQVTIGLRLAGHTVQPIDIRADGALCGVLTMNSVKFPFEPQDVLLFARPCHGAFFVEPTIGVALRRGNRHILYVGFPKNLIGDLGRYRKLFKRVASKVGAEGEALYECPR
jgi:hypothetical protein